MVYEIQCEMKSIWLNGVSLKCVTLDGVSRGCGMVERGTGKCVLVACPNNKRDAATLIPLIQSYVRPGTIIMTDGWRAYSQLPNLGYHHLVVNHSPILI